jgi:hypothetical protein
MSTKPRTPERQRPPRRGTLAILAVLAAVVCGAATISAVMTAPPAVSQAQVTPATAPVIAATESSVAPRPPSPIPAVTLTPIVAPVLPPVVSTTTPSLEPDLVLLGSWTVEYVVGPANGNGANVTVPLRRLDGFVIRPGATFDFWTAVGEVSRRTGYRRGAIIVGHRIDPDGALAGGICTVSTALFNAAARAGLQITARTSHSGYLSKYPVGLDAAVAKGDHFRQTMAFRNDTAEPIVIRTVSTPGIARVDLYGKAELGRTVAFSEPTISRRERAHDRHVTTTTLPRGEHRRVQERSDGMTVVVKRTVRDADGRIVRRDRWMSVYRWLGGTVLDGIG